MLFCVFVVRFEIFRYLYKGVEWVLRDGIGIVMLLCGSLFIC